MIPPEGRSEPCRRWPWAAASARPCPHSASMGIFFLRCSRSFLFDMGHISFRTAFVIDDEVPKEEARRVNCHFSSLHENPVKGWREGADPRGHRHRLGCRARTRPPAIAIGSARIGQASTLSDHRGSRWQAVSRAATCLDQSASRIEIVFERVALPSRRDLSLRFYA